MLRAMRRSDSKRLFYLDLLCLGWAAFGRCQHMLTYDLPPKTEIRTVCSQLRGATNTNEHPTQNHLKPKIMAKIIANLRGAPKSTQIGVGLAWLAFRAMWLCARLCAVVTHSDFSISIYGWAGPASGRSWISEMSLYDVILTYWRSEV